jgi:hypothetical protein
VMEKRQNNFVSHIRPPQMSNKAIAGRRRTGRHIDLNHDQIIGPRGSWP